jgi:hypothetical protein
MMLQFTDGYIQGEEFDRIALILFIHHPTPGNTRYRYYECPTSNDE